MAACSISLLIGCADKRPAKANSETAIRKELAEFLGLALHEFTDEIGSSSHPWRGDAERWERPYVDPALLTLAGFESARLDAFADGIRYQRDHPPVLKPPTPRSFWLPIAAEGSYTFDIPAVTITGDTAVATVSFTMHLGGQTYPEGPVDYHLGRNSGRWKISNVIGGDGFDLKRYLKRPHVMESLPASAESR